MPDRSGDETRIGKGADADSHVDPFLDEVDVAIVQQEFYLDAVVTVEEARRERRDMAPAELHGRGDAQQPAHWRLASTRCGGLIVRDDRTRPFIESAPGLRRREPPRRAIDQAHADAILERRQGARHRRRRPAQALCRPDQTPLLNDAYEDRELVQPVHVILSYSGILLLSLLQLSPQSSEPILEAAGRRPRC